MSKTAETLSGFINDAPPGEVKEVQQDIIALVEGNNQLVANLDKDVAQYNIKEFAIANLDGGAKTVISEYNQLSGSDEFFDAVSGKRFTYNHSTNKATVTGEYTSSSSNHDIKSLARSLETYQAEHYPSQAAFGIFPSESNQDELVIVLVDNKYSPNNFWNGRWKSVYKYSVSAGSISGTVSVDVHYFEDGNVRLKTSKDVKSSAGSSVVHAISKMETEYQSEINKTFVGLNSGPFKQLRRQLPVTRGKMNWARPVSENMIK